MKERFCNAMDDRDLNEIHDIIKEALESEHYRIKDFGKTLKRWIKQIQNYCEHEE